eukprot:gnl/TRDRNA2_/TRDRNA2_95453_c0_seq1.p2 gnl/TRDRNA2_/TRDRNA2_95453_c0~~gnl/TRDRNA2_/TRDRNA2_95453_c0_seq1.p2  ORF type:complete len:132 (-),score=15.76 gnl/TRDRNA2_/TRDRNA2_95453_c0_seq1:108-503(-)
MHGLEPEQLVNATWALAVMCQSERRLFAMLAGAAERHRGALTAQKIVGVAWALASIGLLDAPLCVALFGVGQPHHGMTSEPTLVLCDRVSLLNVMEPSCTLVDYQMLMQCLSAAGQIVAGFAVLSKLEAWW